MTTTLRDLHTLHALPQGAQYRYDQLNRISAMDVWQDLDIPANAWDVSAPLLDYQTRYHYDANGNLLKLKRNAQSATTLAMDDFTYHYAPTNNRLTHVKDAVPATNHNQDIDDQIAGNYSYDLSGNLIADQAEYIQHIIWNTYGKVRSIQRVNGSGRPNLHFEYGADGQRITKQTTYFPPGVGTADSMVFQFYVRDAQGNVMATYNLRPVNGANAPLFLSDHTLYGSARLGQRQQNKIVNQSYVQPGTNNLVGVTYVQRGWKAYELSNHLGNVLSVISDRKEAGHCNDTLVAFYYPDIIQNNDYYPFGSPMEGRGQQSKAYRWGFNGKEKDDEALGDENCYNYGFRIYNPRLGKFLSVDPLTKEYPWYTPFQYAGNKPILFVDLDGLEEMSAERAARERERKQLNISYNDVIKLQTQIQPDAVHGFLDLVGLIPVFGEVADGLNGGLYLLRGEYEDATFSFAAMVPIAGWFATTAKWTKNAVSISRKYGENIADLVQTTLKKGDEGATEIFTITKSGSFKDARTVANDLVDLGDNARDYIGRNGPFKGRVAGKVSADGKSGYRIDWDSESGAHINWWNGNEKGAIPFTGDWDQARRVVENTLGN